jgi:hypothetical protein
MNTLNYTFCVPFYKTNEILVIINEIFRINNLRIGTTPVI